jgi:hypothetical protein
MTVHPEPPSDLVLESVYRILLYLPMKVHELLALLVQ